MTLDMSIADYLLLFLAGMLGGVINTLAGGGSLVTFPSLMLVGVPPIIANATNTFASLGGYISGAYGLRKEIRKSKSVLVAITITATIGGLVGAWLLHQTSPTRFEKLIPWLLFLATVALILGPVLVTSKKESESEHDRSIVSLLVFGVLLLLVCLYGGFFNAGLGILILGYLTIAGWANVNEMNAVKLIVSSIVSVAAVCVFAFSDMLDWQLGVVVMIGTLIGGYLSAKVSLIIPAKWIRTGIIVFSLTLTIYYFAKVY